ncbi:uncharacterized protein DSM5745_09085 [Aspergillus mulundensis]|uniref:Uncharacterized protein n=1 Tax=Aspergillus mulundensis TaxID=1810919 RepID=A0A3D8QZK8_9EURO|nr:Uncharacterized protein DSM5745_09085 [Aspergillus mulundensis]RDW67219.1 Uncharacterized protein DSM5745_09085 [Aspergillus mulundensis]
MASSDTPPGYPRITPSSPIRDFGPGRMDYERCAALHNELLTRVVKAKGGSMPPAPPSWWEARAPPPEVADALHPSLIEFLKRAWDEDVLLKPLFFFIGALKFPEGFFEDDVRYSFGLVDEPGRFLKLYQAAGFRMGDDEGLLFDQKSMKASFVEDYNDTKYITSHEWSWMPLEVILDSYLQMIDEGKVTAIPATLPELRRDFTVGVVEPWMIHQYTKTDLERATTAFKRLIHAIESRVENQKKDKPIALLDLPWHDPAIYNKDILPSFSFAHEFLTAISACKVSFRYIAPGIRFPTTPEFNNQPITDFVTSPHRNLGQFPGNCPLRLFQVDTDTDTETAGELVGPCDYHNGIHNITPGFYINPVVERWPLFWSNGCRLFLPFGIGRQGWARFSNGQPLGLRDGDLDFEEARLYDDPGALYQAGITNGITNAHLVVIDKVLNNWAERVEGGDWEVDGDGVRGGIEKFREADTEEHWEKYWIPPSW